MAVEMFTCMKPISAIHAVLVQSFMAKLTYCIYCRITDIVPIKYPYLIKYMVNNYDKNILYVCIINSIFAFGYNKVCHEFIKDLIKNNNNELFDNNEYNK